MAKEKEAIENKCIFCSIAEGKSQAKILFQDENMTVFQDIHPQAPVHWLAIPRTHLDSISESVDPIVIGNLISLLTRIANEKSIKDYRLIINRGPLAGQTVFHMHIHLLAGRQMHWPPG